jgi:hypothetical protein
MDPVTVALAGTVVAGLSVIVTAGTTIWVTRQNRKAQREERTQRRFEAYVQVLEFAQREGQYLAARKYNFEQWTWDAYGVAQRRTATQPEPTARATTDALVLAYASPDVTEAHRAWLAAVDAAREALEVLEWNLSENHVPGQVVAKSDLEPFMKLTQAEADERQRLAASVSSALRTT